MQAVNPKEKPTIFPLFHKVVKFDVRQQGNDLWILTMFENRVLTRNGIPGRPEAIGKASEKCIRQCYIN
jgi:hypothetical protein